MVCPGINGWHKYGVLRWSKTGSQVFPFMILSVSSIAWCECVALPLAREDDWRYCSWYHVCTGSLLITPSTLSINWIYSHPGLVFFLSLSLSGVFGAHVHLCIVWDGVGLLSVHVIGLIGNKADDHLLLYQRSLICLLNWFVGTTRKTMKNYK